MAHYSKRKCFSLVAAAVLSVLAATSLVPAEGVATSVTVSATSSGISVGELTVVQMTLLALVFLKIVVLTAAGYLPVSIDLSKVLDSISYLYTGRRPHYRQPAAYEDVYEDVYQDYHNFSYGYARGFYPDAEMSTYLLDCPLQFVCDVDAWANRDHDYYLESLVASWFRNSNHTWQRPDSEVYGGRGTCKEMYPCPFDVQEVVGIRIPGSNALSGTEEESYSFF